MLVALSNGLGSCKKPAGPEVDPRPPTDASAMVRAIQLEEQRVGKQVELLARGQVAQELESSRRALSAATGNDGGGETDAGEPIARGGTDELAGKLERATGDQLIIRDESGFAYWLDTSDTTHVSRNGQPAQLTDFKQGADVRASFVWQGNKRVATDVEVLD